MKLYMHPVSMTSRPVRLFIAESGIDVDEQVVDLFTGEHYKEPYASLNPNRLVPMLEDGDLRLTESSAILKYLADKTGSPLYPQELRQRARVNERMDWVNTQLSRDLNYGTVYPQIFSFHKRRSDEAQAATLEWGVERARGHLKVLDGYLGAGGYVCGDAPTIADYQASSSVALAEILGCDFAAYPNVKAWLARMKSLKSWKQVYEAIDGYAATLKGQTFVAP